MISPECACVTDIDGRDYVDLCLADTGAMTGHGPPVVLAAVREQCERGMTTMLPTEDSVLTAEELTRRFGVSQWLFTLSATDANRTALRIARQVTGRGKVQLLPGRSVACVLAEPAMTNMGIILPDEGYHQALREITSDTGTLLIIDEAHTLSAGLGGRTAAWGLDPDLVTLGNAIGAGIASGALGLTGEVYEARHLVRGAHRRRLRANDPPRHPVRRGRTRRHLGCRARLARHPARLPRRVPVPAAAAP